MGDREIGIAIEIPEPYGGELQAWRHRLGDPQALRIVPHVTLLPPSPVEADRLDEVEEHLKAVAREMRTFPIHLRGSGSFRPVSPVVFVPLADGISSCERLEARVRSGPLARETRFPYHPHVTVAHHVDDDRLERGFRELATYEARFPAWGFTLYELGEDSCWRPQRDFPFGSAVPGPHVGHHAG